MKRYTDGQMRLLKLNPNSLSEEERTVLHRLLLPRSVYLPAEPSEQDALALDWLGQKKYDALLAFCDVLRDRYGEGLEFFWSRGEKQWKMYRCARVRGKSLCRFGIMYRDFRLILLFGLRECREFESLRNTFSRDQVQWSFDMIAERGGVHPICLDIEQPNVASQALRLLSIKLAPKNTTT